MLSESECLSQNILALSVIAAQCLRKGFLFPLRYAIL